MIGTCMIGTCDVGQVECADLVVLTNSEKMSQEAFEMVSTYNLLPICMLLS